MKSTVSELVVEGRLRLDRRPARVLLQAVL